jgi:hypothetical protein
MNINDLLNTIEDIRFSAEFSVIEQFRVLQIAFGENRMINELINRMKESRSDSRIVWHHFVFLLKTNIDLQYRHPLDLAIAAYLFAFQQADFSLAHMSAQLIELTPNVWWAKKLADQIIEQARTRQATVVFAMQETVSKSMYKPQSTSDMSPIQSKTINRSSSSKAVNQGYRYQKSVAV